MTRLHDFPRRLRGCENSGSRTEARRPGRSKPRRPDLEALERLVLMSDVPEVESNNDPLVATSLPLLEDRAGSGFFTRRGTGAISPSGDLDYWKFVAQAGPRVTVAAYGGSGNSAARITLRDASNNQLMESTDTTNGRPQITNYLIGAAGTYFARVVTQNNSDTLAAYQLCVDLSNGFLQVSEANDSLATASVTELLPSGGMATGKVSGSIRLATDVDDFNLGSLRSRATHSPCR
jgi:Bacterial pre-peptidase C-terminal domain